MSMGSINTNVLQAKTRTCIGAHNSRVNNIRVNNSPCNMPRGPRNIPVIIDRWAGSINDE